MKGAFINMVTRAYGQRGKPPRVYDTVMILSCPYPCYKQLKTSLRRNMIIERKSVRE